MSKTPIKPQLWTKRPVAETIAVYADWADSYDDDLAERGYHTPARLTQALLEFVPLTTTVLDYGCGTGISGRALKAAGYTSLHGTDITPEMLAVAEEKGLYDKLWHSEPGAALSESYDAIVAVGVVSLGAAPPETLHILVDALNSGGILGLSFNDPTLEDGSYDAELARRVADSSVEIMHRSHGPHLEDVGMGSDVIVLKRR